MKQSIIKSLAIGLSLLATVSLSAQNNYQLPNNGFESWDGSANDAEPTHWNSFATCDGSWSSLASSTHHYHRHGSRPGGTGSHYLTIYTQSILGIVALKALVKRTIGTKDGPVVDYLYIARFGLIAVVILAPFGTVERVAIDVVLGAPVACRIGL